MLPVHCTVYNIHRKEITNKNIVLFVRVDQPFSYRTELDVAESDGVFTSIFLSFKLLGKKYLQIFPQFIQGKNVAFYTFCSKHIQIIAFALNFDSKKLEKICHKTLVILSHLTILSDTATRELRRLQKAMQNLFVLKVTWKRTLWAAVYLSEAPSPHRFLFWGGHSILQTLNLVTYRV